MGWPPRFWLRHRELLELRRREREMPKPELPARIFGSNSHRGPVWQIPVPGRDPVFMRVGMGGPFIVYVDARAFHRAWFELGKKARLPCPLRRDMPKDYKFHWAEDGFAPGRVNPVPLASPTARDMDGTRLLDFGNGYTRTLWLLAHDVAAFPVQCVSEDEAQRLFEVAGLAPPIHRDELTP